MLTLVLIISLILTADLARSSFNPMSNEKELTIFSRGITKYELAHLFSRNLSHLILSSIAPHSPCFSPLLMPFDDDYAAKEALQVKKIAGDITLVSIPRLIATLWLGRAALSLGHGDFVETG